MTTPSPSISPLRQRMMDDMRMRRLAPTTQANYLRVVRQFAAFLGRSPDTATVEDLRRYQLHLVDHGVSPVSLNAAITGLKFFFGTTLGQEAVMAKMRPIYLPRTLPVILSRDEVGRLIAAAGHLKHQTALALAYGTGLRASEVVALKVGDIDSQRMTLRVEQGKGQKCHREHLAEGFLVSDCGYRRISESVQVGPQSVTKKPFVLNRSAGGRAMGIESSLRSASARHTR